MESPEAMAPRIVDTRTRVPRITGLPWQTDGFISRRLFTVEQYDVPHGHQVPMSTLSACHLPQPGQRIPPGLSPQVNRTNHPASSRDATPDPSDPSNLPHLHQAAIPRTLTLRPQMPSLLAQRRHIRGMDGPLFHVKIEIVAGIELLSGFTLMKIRQMVVLAAVCVD